MFKFCWSGGIHGGQEVREVRDGGEKDDEVDRTEQFPRGKGINPSTSTQASYFNKLSHPFYFKTISKTSQTDYSIKVASKSKA